jgi:hypothetical protein
MPAVIGTVLALGAVALVGGLDATIGPRLAFAPFYAVAVALSAWYAGFRHAIFVALAAGAIRLS